MRTFSTFSLTLLAAAALTVGPAVTAPATAGTHHLSAPLSPETSGVGIRLVDIPADAQSDPRARSYIVDSLPPGTTIERRIEVENTSASPKVVRVYAGAATIVDGSFVGMDGAAVNELTSWTSMDTPIVELAANTSAEVLVTVAVPADAPEGEQYAAIWAEVSSDPSADTNVVTASRAGIRMYVSVGPGNGPPSDFSIDGLTASRLDTGEPAVTATVTNTGGRALDVSGSLTLTDGPSGLSAGPFSNGTAATIAPGESSEVLVTLGADLPNGPWQAKLELKSGLVARDVSAQITFPDAGSVTVQTDGPNTLLIAIGIALAVVVVIATAATALILARRRKALTAAPPEAERNERGTNPS